MTVTPFDVVDLDRTRFHYECSAGHLIANAAGELSACPVFVLGAPCHGVLVRFGPGSRTRVEAVGG